MSDINLPYIIKAKNSKKGKIDDVVSVVLLSENHGYRMKSHGPISLVTINGKTLLERQIEALSAVFVNFEVVLCCGFETNKVYSYIRKTWGPRSRIRLVENQVYYHSNCCESLRLCMNNITTERMLVCSGGVLMTPGSLKSLDLRKSSMIYQEYDKKDDFEVGIIENNDKLEFLSLAARDKIWTETLFLSGSKNINSFYNLISNPEYKNKFFFEAINAWPSRRNINIYENVSSQIIKINNIKTLKRIKNENSV